MASPAEPLGIVRNGGFAADSLAVFISIYDKRSFRAFYLCRLTCQ